MVSVSAWGPRVDDGMAFLVLGPLWAGFDYRLFAAFALFSMFCSVALSEDCECGWKATLKMSLCGL